MIPFKRTLLLGAVCAALLGDASKTSALDFTNAAVSFKAAHAQINLLLGKEKKPWQWSPEFTGPVKKRSRQTPLGAAVEYTTVCQHPDGFELVFHQTKLKHKPYETVRYEFVNRTKEVVRLRNFVMLDGRIEYQGDPNAWMVAGMSCSEKNYGTIEAKKGKSTTFDDDFTLYRGGSKVGLMIGPVLGVADLPCTATVDSEGRMQLRVVSNMSDVMVDPDETRTSEEALISFGDWRGGGTDRSEWVAATHGRVKPRELLFGWCSWYAAGQAVTGADILNMVSFVKTNPATAPFNMLLIDEGYQVARHDWNANEKFPQGMTYYAEQIRAAGLMPGIWITALTPDSRRIVDGKVKEFQLYTGEVVRVFDESWYEGFADGHPSKGWLDATHPGAQAYMRKWISTLKGQGYDLIKTDFTGVPDSKNRYNNKLTRFQVQRELFKLYREAMGDDAYMLMCRPAPERSCAGIADAKRIGADTLPWRGFDGTHIKELGDDLSLYNGIKKMVSTANENGVLYTGDPDVTYVEATGPVNEAEMQTFHSMVGLYGGTAYFGGKLWQTKWTPEKFRRIGMLYPNIPEKGYPFAGGFDMLGEQFGMEILRPWGNYVNAFIWHGQQANTEPRPMGIKDVPIERIGEKFHAYDFWADKYLGVIDRTYTKECKRYEGQLLRLTAIKDLPQLIGSNLHITIRAHRR